MNENYWKYDSASHAAMEVSSWTCQCGPFGLWHQSHEGCTTIKECGILFRRQGELLRLDTWQTSLLIEALRGITRKYEIEAWVVWPQDVKGVGVVECSQPRREMCAACSKTKREQVSKPIDSRYEAIVSGFCSAELLQAFIQYFLTKLQFLHYRIW